MSFWSSVVDFFIPGPIGDAAERLVRRGELEWAVDSAISDMQGMAGNEGQATILNNKVPGPFRQYFMQEAIDYGPDFGSFESAMRTGMGGDEYYEAVELILEVGFEYASSSF